MTSEHSVWAASAYLTVYQAAILLNISRSGIYTRLKEGKPGFDATFPRPKKFGRNAVRFSKAELLQWAEARSLSGEMAA